MLLTNDDGIDAPGLQALVESVQLAYGDRLNQVMIVAPNRGRSECGHSVTTRHPLQIEELGRNRIAVSGTPVDCVRIALSAIASQVDLVLSGVNAGANLGVDLMVSGTFAAAREAAMHGVPAMAISHYRQPNVAKSWDHVPSWLNETLLDFANAVERRRNELGNDMSGHWEQTPLWNVNLPAIDPASPPPERRRCGVDPTPIMRVGIRDGETVHLRSDFHGRPRRPGLDVDRCFSGWLTISNVSPLVHDRCQD